MNGVSLRTIPLQILSLGYKQLFFAKKRYLWVIPMFVMLLQGDSSGTFPTLPTAAQWMHKAFLVIEACLL
jgi:hypothetical protein